MVILEICLLIQLMAEILHQLRLVVQICRDCCTSLRYLNNFMCRAAVLVVQIGRRWEGDVVQTDVAWLKNADRKILAEGCQFGSTPETKVYKNQWWGGELEDRLRNKFDLTMISFQGHFREVLEPGTWWETSETTQYIYIYHHILSIVARYSWCHVTMNPMTWSHDFTVHVFVTADSSDSTDQGHGYDDSKLTVMLKSAMSNLQTTHETILQVRFIGLLFCQFFPFCDWHGLTWIHWLILLAFWCALNFFISWKQTYANILYIATSSKLWYSWYRYLWYVLVQSDIFLGWNVVCEAKFL